MGNCNYGPEVAAEVFANAPIPDISLDASFVRYLNINSPSELQHHYSQTKSTLTNLDQIKSYSLQVQNLLGNSMKFPNGGVGVMALMLSLLFDVAAQKAKQQTTSSVIQAIFNEEKVSEIGNLIDSYYKRVQIYRGYPSTILTETEDYERRISFQMTKVYNSMEKDRHMNTRDLKGWLNGAAFHVHLLIHLARLGKVDENPAIVANMAYMNEFENLLPIYREYLRENVVVSEHRKQHCGMFGCTGKDGHVYVDGVSRSHTVYFNNNCIWSVSQSVADYIVGHHPHVLAARIFFKETSENMQKLIQQKEDFSIQ